MKPPTSSVSSSCERSAVERGERGERWRLGFLGGTQPGLTKALRWAPPVTARAAKNLSLITPSLRGVRGEWEASRAGNRAELLKWGKQRHAPPAPSNCRNPRRVLRRSGMFATGLSSQPSSLLQPATGKCIACCACQVLLSQTRHQVHTSTRRGQSCEREAAPSMAPRSLPVTCLTLALVMEHPPATLGFHLAPRQANRPKSRLRARPPSSEPPRDASRRAVPAPKRRPPADIDASTLESALLNMNLAGTKAPKQKQVGSNAAADAVCSADVSHDGVLAEVLRQIARGDVFQAIATVAAAPAELATAGRGGSSGGKGDSVARDGFTAVLKACAGRGLWREAKDVLVRHMPAAGVEAAAADWLLAIDACAGAGGSERVILHLHDMRARYDVMLLLLYAMYMV